MAACFAIREENDYVVFMTDNRRVESALNSCCVMSLVLNAIMQIS